MRPAWRMERLERLTRKLPVATSTVDLPSGLADLEGKMLRERDMPEEEVDAIIGAIVAFYESQGPPPVPIFLGR